MGHVTLITDEVVKFLENCPAGLKPDIEQTFAQSEWEAYRDGPFRVTKERDLQPLAGGRVAPPAANTSAVADGQDSDSDDEEGTLAKTLAGPPLARSVAHSADGFDTGIDNQVCISGRSWAQLSAQPDHAALLAVPAARNPSERTVV